MTAERGKLQRLLSVLRRLANTVLDQGVTTSVPDRLKRRIRIANGLAVFAGILLLASIPFDLAEAPRWTVIADVVAGLAYLTFPLINRRGHLTASRVLAMVVSNLIVLGDSIVLGPESGTSLIFFALFAVPFALFDLSERAPLALSVTLAAVGFGLVSSDIFT